jgi:hypothetical protein
VSRVWAAARRGRARAVMYFIVNYAEVGLVDWDIVEIILSFEICRHEERRGMVS